MNRVRRVSALKPVVVVTEEEIVIFDTFGEVMYWHETEWEEDPDMLDQAIDCCMGVLRLGNTAQHREHWKRPPDYSERWDNQARVIAQHRVWWNPFARTWDDY